MPDPDAIPPQPRTILLPLVGLLVLAGFSGGWGQGRALQQGMEVLGPELVLIGLLGAYLAFGRARAVPGEARGWLWLGVHFLAGSGQGLLVGLVLRHPSLGGWGNLNWFLLAFIQQGAAIMAVASWPWRDRKAGQRALTILGSILFCGSLLLIMWNAVNWTPILGHTHLVDNVFKSASMRVALFGGVSVYLLTERPGRWQGPLGWLFLNAVGGAVMLSLLYPYWVYGVAWMQGPIFLVALLSGSAMTLAAYTRRPVEAQAGVMDAHSRFWEHLPYATFSMAALLTIAHFLIHPQDARTGIVALVLLLVPLLWRQILLYRAVRLANENLEARVQARTRDLEAAQTRLLQEVAEHQRSQEALHRAFAAVEQSASSIVITDTEGTVEYVNEAFTAFTGYAAAEALGRTLRILKSGEHTQAFYEELWHTLRQGRTWRGRFHNRTKAGDLIWEQAVISPVRNALGVVTHFVASKENITEALKLDEERQHLAQQFAQSQKLEGLGRLAGGVAHDMNNVLGAILAMASSSLEQLPGDSPMRHHLDTISRAAHRGGQVVRSLLNFARQAPAEEGPVDLNAVVQEVVQLLKWTTLAKVSLELDLEEGLQPIQGDGATLVHAFMNLCVNAVDAMTGEGTLTLQTRSAGPERVEVRVRDTGSGMTREVLRRALDPFFTTKGIGKGTGLGLAMVDGVIKAHRGAFELESEPGQGTCAIIRFPALAHVARVPEAGPGRPEATRTLNLLVVDDDELMQGAMRDLLGMLGHEALISGSGEEALAELGQGAFDGVILDINMPGLGGEGTLPRLRALQAALPVLLVTGKADQTALDLAARFPRVALLPKPFTLAQLRKQLESWS